MMRVYTVYYCRCRPGDFGLSADFLPFSLHLKNKHRIALFLTGESVMTRGANVSE